MVCAFTLCALFLWCLVYATQFIACSASYNNPPNSQCTSLAGVCYDMRETCPSGGACLPESNSFVYINASIPITAPTSHVQQVGRSGSCDGDGACSIGMLFVHLLFVLM